MDGSVYDSSYFLRGRQTGKSLYEDYRWMPDLTVPMVERMVDHLGISEDDSVLDFGCARGYVVKAFRLLGYDAWGVDVSRWAIENADEETKPYLIQIEDIPPLMMKKFDWIVAKDVLEHVSFIDCTVGRLMDAAIKGVFVVVPLSIACGCNYVVPEYEKDVTHIHRLTLATWAGKFMRPGWSVDARYQVDGIKDNYAGWPYGNGFITARRIK